MDLDSLLNDDRFASDVSAAKTPEEIAVLFTEKGFEMTADDVVALLKADTGELSEDDLDHVAGGIGLGKYAVLGGVALIQWLKKHGRSLILIL